MPWSQTTPMDPKTQFIADYLRQRLSITELCELYGISRKTGYKVIDRYLRLGPQGLEELSRRPASCPNRTPEHIEQAIVAARQRHPSWGAKKLLSVLHKSHRRWSFPTRSTPCATYSVGMGWCLSNAVGDTSVIPASPSAKSLHRTICGVPTSRGSSKPAMDCTVIRLL